MEILTMGSARGAKVTVKPKTWITADTCFHLANIRRPFRDIEEMDNVLVRRWNEVVAPDDTVYHLGDVAFGGARLRDSLLPRLNGYKILRLGDRDKRPPTKSGWLKYFNEVYEDDILLDDLCLSHHPLTDYEMVRLLALGLIKGNVHGHVQSQINDLDHTKYKCVSVELTDYRPVDFDEVKKHFGIGIGGSVK